MRVIAWAVCVWGAVSAGCARSIECRDDVVETRCVARGGAPEAIGTAAGATALQVTVGCRAQGCLGPFECNERTGLCERMRCGERQGACPPPYECNAEHRCE